MRYKIFTKSRVLNLQNKSNGVEPHPNGKVNFFHDLYACLK
jgi:hypothetical protein